MPSPAAHAAPLVAIVDDDPSVRRALERLVALAGFTVRTFASGAELLEFGGLARAACLVLDIHLGDMNGFDLPRRLGARGLTIPTIFITAHDEASALESARRAGAVAYLAKPIAGKTLLDAIRQALIQLPPAR